MQRKCHPAWWRCAVIYQVYPRSFQDSNADGIGDLRGILSRIDYIASLGVDALWINPVFSSPGKDNGYDISDYRSIGPAYGTMTDMEELILRAHEKGLRIILDMVFNHTSNVHEWFRQACLSRDNPFYSYYHWWPAERGRPPYRCGFFDAAGEAWQYNAPTDSWYLHYFSPEQPDLNWENPRVRRELYDILRFWIGKGVDGFRFDAITFVAKDTSWPEIALSTLRDNYQGDWGNYYASSPHLHGYLKEMRREILGAPGGPGGSDGGAPEILLFGEAPGVPPEQSLLFVGEDRGELDLISHFDGMVLGYLQGEYRKPDPNGYNRSQFKQVYSTWTDLFRRDGWGTVYLGSHDQPRMVSRWGDDRGEFRIRSAKLLLTFLLTMRATPIIYNGDELGMRNIRFASIDDYRDIETIQNYQRIATAGGDPEAFLRDQQLAGRDNGRTPFQWTAGPQGGFTTATPWLRVNPDHRWVNREAEEADPGSVLNYTRALLRLRRRFAALTAGDFNLLNHDDSPVLAYSRSLGRTTIAVLLNFSGEEAPFDGLLSLSGQVLINNDASVSRAGKSLRLAPWQALVFDC
ncbi:MAG TPA: alpha-glucosidase [Puia sp.]|uniref:glycoside hydrolase family 13 protein n=1 Tax=Puia sp. TaxID=2045100 RepID=UPI002C9C6977|nr:alpha-glucosidase [Puia sp.]HVU98163.1 alpha-glucosidase [Puia sp.]